MSDRSPGPAEADYRFWCEEKLRNADTDQQGHVNNAVIATLFESGRIEVLSAPEIAAIRQGTRIVVVKTLIHFRKELFFPGRVRIGTRVPRIGRTSIEFESAVFATNGVVASSESTCVLMDRASHKPTPVPEALRVFLAGGEGGRRPETLT